MVDMKVVIGTSSGKTFQKELKGPESDNLLKKRIGDTIAGDLLGFAGYEFLITGGSDKAGFPMRKGIQAPRKLVLIGESVGFSGKKRPLGKKTTRRKQKGLVSRRTVCGEMITKIIHQVNIKITKEGPQPLDGAEEAAEPKAE